MADKPKNALTFKHKFGYALGDAGGCMTFALMSGMFLRYCNNVLLINEYVFATLLFVWNVWDAVNDPLMGALMDKMFAKKRHPRASSVPGCCAPPPCCASSPSPCGHCPPCLKALP